MQMDKLINPSVRFSRIDTNNTDVYNNGIKGVQPHLEMALNQAIKDHSEESKLNQEEFILNKLREVLRLCHNSKPTMKEIEFMLTQVMEDCENKTEHNQS